MGSKEFIRQYDLRKQKEDTEFLQEIDKEIQRIDDVIADHKAARAILSNLKTFYLTKHENPNTIIT